jgi:hypothetical protein
VLDIYSGLFRFAWPRKLRKNVAALSHVSQSQPQLRRYNTTRDRQNFRCSENGALRVFRFDFDSTFKKSDSPVQLHQSPTKCHKLLHLVLLAALFASFFHFSLFGKPSTGSFASGPFEKQCPSFRPFSQPTANTVRSGQGNGKHFIKIGICNIKEASIGDWIRTSSFSFAYSSMTRCTWPILRRCWNSRS